MILVAVCQGREEETMDSLDELKELVESKQFRKLKFVLEKLNEADIADFLEELNPEQALLVFPVFLLPL